MKPGLADLPNIVIVPHIASASMWTRSGMVSEWWQLNAVADCCSAAQQQKQQLDASIGHSNIGIDSSCWFN